MTYESIDKQTDTELIALVLNKRQVDDECIAIAKHLAKTELVGASTIVSVVREFSSSSSAILTKASRIDAAIELGKRALQRHAVREITNINEPEDILELMEPRYAGAEREMFYCISLDMKNNIKNIAHISTGSLNASIVHPRELFRTAVSVSAAAVIICHNHPSGDPIPSGADIQLTRRIRKAGEVLGIELLDHVVLGGDGKFESMRDAGLF